MSVNSLVSGTPSYSKLSYESMLSLLEFIKMSVVFSPFMVAASSYAMTKGERVHVFLLLGEIHTSEILFTWLLYYPNSIIKKIS